jgi:hypothetical protein
MPEDLRSETSPKGAAVKKLATAGVRVGLPAGSDGGLGSIRAGVPKGGGIGSGKGLIPLAPLKSITTEQTLVSSKNNTDSEN